MADASDRRPAPIASGTLGATPLSNALVYARNKRLTGAFEVHAPEGGGEGAIVFYRGRIEQVRVTPSPCYFGAVVYELGLIDSSALDATLLEVAQKKKLHGEVLVERGLITPAQRDEALVEQACRKVHHLFSLPPETTFAFFDARPKPVEPPLLVDPLTPAWRGVRDYPPEKGVKDVLTRFGTATLRMVNEAPIDCVGFTPDEKALALALSERPMTIGQMRAFANGLTADRVSLLAFFLLAAKCIEPIASSSQPKMPAVRGSQPGMAAVRPSLPAPTASKPPAPPPSSPSVTPSPPPSRPSPASGRPAIPAPPLPRTIHTPHTPHTPGPPYTTTVTTPSGEIPVRPPSFRVLASVPQMAAVHTSAPPPKIEAIAPIVTPAELGPAGIAARAKSIETESYFAILGVDEGATPEAVRAAYHRLAKVWHPDRMLADLAPMRSEIETIFTHMTRAHRTLTDPDARRGYLATHGEASETKKRPRGDVLKEIDGLLTRRDFPAAEAEARKLHDQSAEDADALAIVAWASAFGGDASEEVLRASLVLLDRAVYSDRYSERAYYYRGVVNKRLGNEAAAFRDFSRVVQIAPKHVDAQREVRLFEMRARKGSGLHARNPFSKAKK